MQKREKSMAESTLDEYLSVLNEQQREAVIHEGSPLLILAGAGSGKTRVITTKIAYLIGQKNVNPYSILSVTFTKKAANEMRERAVRMEPLAEKAQIRTFHSLGSYLLRRFSDDAGLDRSFTVYDDEDMAILVRNAVPALSKQEVKLAVKQISLAKDYCLGPKDDLSIIASDLDLSDIYSKYETRLRATGNVDFGDLITLPVQLMQESPEIAAQIHSWFNVFLVDEYQDSNIAQFKFLKLISGVNEGYQNYVCVVGDDDQSIYKFRGAEVKNILSFPQQFPGTEIIRLERNYRSTSEILSAASLVVNNNKDRLGKTLIADRGEGGLPVLAYLPDQNAEVQFCLELFRKHKDNGGKYSDWAIMYRTNAQSRSFETALQKNHIPNVVFGTLRFFEREEIKDALSYLSLCANPRDEIAFKRIINKPSRGIGDKTQKNILELAKEEKGDGDYTYKSFLDVLSNIKSEFSKKALEGAENFINLYKKLEKCFDENKRLSDLFDLIINESGLYELHENDDVVEGTQRKENLQELVNSAIDYKCTRDGLIAYLDSISLDNTIEMENSDSLEDYVTLITLHNTKGLEYNNVIITGLEQGVFPRENKVGADLEEERRLFYVGITRAKDELYVTSTGQRVLYGHTQFMSPSIFLNEAEEAFKVVGQKPRAQQMWGYGGYYRKSSGSEIESKWAVGTKLYHDDYGYGVVVSARMNGSDFMIEVQFETGAVKKFLPEYQAKSLQIIK